LWVRSGLCRFQEFAINLTIVDDISNEQYLPRDDDSKFIVKSFDCCKSGENYLIELENLFNLHHPYIAPSMSFIFPGDSQELMIVQLYAERNSLSEVISTNREWWTATGNAKAAVGIVLGLRFLHSFGLIHGHFNSNNLIFDSDHRIQITDFCPIGFDFGESPTDADMHVRSFSGEGWSIMIHFSGFASILFEMVDDRLAAQPNVSGSETSTTTAVPVFVSTLIAAGQSPESHIMESFIDIFDFLKENDFAIRSAVNIECSTVQPLKIVCLLRSVAIDFPFKRRQEHNQQYHDLHFSRVHQCPN
jgi:serine/threonine protein kinase